MKMKFVRFSRDPLKVFVGQKLLIKLNFNDSVPRLNLNVTGFSPNDFLELRPDADGKKYFNCISSITVSEMPSA